MVIYLPTVIVSCQHGTGKLLVDVRFSWELVGERLVCLGIIVLQTLAYFTALAVYTITFKPHTAYA